MFLRVLGMVAMNKEATNHLSNGKSKGLGQVPGYGQSRQLDGETVGDGHAPHHTETTSGTDQNVGRLQKAAKGGGFVTWGKIADVLVETGNAIVQIGTGKGGYALSHFELKIFQLAPDVLALFLLLLQ